MKIRKTCFYNYHNKFYNVIIVEKAIVSKHKMFVEVSVL